ncbi:MAG: VCBS repeat-containing protein, partial [Hyphomicrobiales bacterium]|nr:VCBS repeat-containing protein [Hyphomicrobiales bacterium]
MSRPSTAFGKALLFGLLASTATPLSALAQSCAGGAIPCLQGLGFLPGAESRADRFSDLSTWGFRTGRSMVNANGTVVVGQARNASGQIEGFRWVNGAMQGLGKLPGQYAVCANGSCSIPSAVSQDGSTVVGVGFVNEPGNAEAFRARPFVWSGGTMSEISRPCSPSNPNDGGEAYGVSANGSVIVGQYQCNGASSPQAFRHSGGSTALLGFLAGHNRSSANSVSADGSVVVGSSLNYPQGNTMRAFRWAGGMTALPFDPAIGAAGTSATAISSDASTVAGWTGNAGLRWGAGRMTELGEGIAEATSGDGSVIVPSGWIWTARTGRLPFPSLLAAHGIDTSQWTELGGPVSVSADGRTFAGFGTDLNGKTQAWIARIPLPPTAHDFDRSANSDILWRHSSGQVAMWLMNGTSVAQGPGVGGAAADWQIVGQRDFNGDGKHDILWRNSSSGQVLLWVMNGAAVTQSAVVGSAASDWQIVGTGDFNADGKGDILWRHS